MHSCSSTSISHGLPLPNNQLPRLTDGRGFSTALAHSFRSWIHLALYPNSSLPQHSAEQPLRFPLNFYLASITRMIFLLLVIHLPHRAKKKIMQHFKTTSRKPLSLQMATLQLGQIVKIPEELTATWEIKNLFYSIKICKKIWREGWDVANLLVASTCLKLGVGRRKGDD